MKNLSTIVSKNIHSYATKKDTVSIIAESINSSLEENAQNVSEKISYYIKRALEEIANNIQDINFDLNNILTADNAEIVDITTDEKNITYVYITKQIKLEDMREMNKVREALKAITISSKFSKYVSLSVEGNSENLVLKVKLVLPQAYVNSIGGEDYKKRNSAVDKAVKKLVESSLD